MTRTPPPASRHSRVYSGSIPTPRTPGSNMNAEKVVSVAGHSGFTESLRQVPTEFLGQSAQGRGDGLRVTSRGRARASQVSLADLYRLISANRSEPPSREQRSRPFGIHVELFYIDGYSPY